MLFFKNHFAALLAVAAVGVNGSPVELEKRDFAKVILCPNNSDVIISKWCPSYDLQPGTCIDLAPENDDKISIVMIGAGMSCTFFMLVKISLVVLSLFY